MLSNKQPSFTGNNRRTIIYDLLLIVVMLAGAYLRLVGYKWGEYSYLHPDERFLLMVGSDISPIKDVAEPQGSNPDAEPKKIWIGLSDYFNTSTSPLNPNNRGYGFYVYGTLPLFMTRVLADLIYENVGLQEIQDLGRPLSALSDLLVVLVVYLIAARLYNRRVGLLAAAFYAAAVLPIQLSHYFKEDTFTNFFTYLAIYFAVVVGTTAISSQQHPQRSWGAISDQQPGTSDQGSGKVVGGLLNGVQASSAVNVSRITFYILRFISHPYFLLSTGFGVALGCAVASKLNAVPVAAVLPGAFALQYFSAPPRERQRRLFEALAYGSLAAVVSLLAFRIFQPYAFSGPGFLGIKPNPAWIQQIKDQRAQAGGDVDFPPALQWARRPIWFSGENLVVWGLGLPLGLLAWAGFLGAGWRMLKGEWQKHILVWGWLAFYFAWQTTQFNPTMRYQLPSYPALVIFAAWLVVYLYDRRRQTADRSLGSTAAGGLSPAVGRRIWQVLAVLVGGFVLLATFAWAFAFSRIYTRPITRIEASRWIYENIPGPINLNLQTGQGPYNHPVTYYPYDFQIRPGQAYNTNFQARASGELRKITFAHAVDPEGAQGEKTLVVELFAPGQEQPAGTGRLTADFLPGSDPRRQSYQLSLDRPVQIEAGKSYNLVIQMEAGEGAVQLQGDAVANEGAWDDGIPYPIDGYNGFGGIYPQEVNFDMYNDETEEKRDHFYQILDQADFLFITSNRQWGVLPRLPERYPMSTAYYRRLLGCPQDRTIQWCYNVAQPGMFHGEMGFDLVKVFQSEPQLGPLTINTQFAEEAFTVYDHPKVFIFKKTAAYNPEQVQAILGAVDLSKVIHLTPKKAPSHPADLMLPEDRLAEQQAGGTWSELFNSQAVYNRFQPLGVILWYLAVFVLGLAVYPLVRLALPGLADHGYPLARIAGLLMLAYPVWLAGSFRVPASRLTITVVFLLMAILGGWLAYRQRDELRQEWQGRRRYFLLVEGLFLAFFLFDLLIRLGNPDLWHQFKGGEKPMDFAYFNAVLKSTSFPPYDPWFAGGYLNYYYYGFVLVGVLVKWLGIVPSFAYNLILPTLFSLIAMGAFSVAWNIFGSQTSAISHQPSAVSSQPSANGDQQPGTWDQGPGISDPPFANRDRIETQYPTAMRESGPGKDLQPVNEPAVGDLPNEDETYTGAVSGISPTVAEKEGAPNERRNTQYASRYSPSAIRNLQVWVAVAAALGMAMLGNLGTIRMIWQGYEHLGSPDGQIEGAPFFIRNVWGVRGFFDALGGKPLPYSLGDWYWNPSRVMPPSDNAITEFPFFTVLYADPHAHLYALPVALLALSWAVSVVLGRGRWKGMGGAVAGFLLGGLVIGALYPINLSDIYTYLPLGISALAYALWRYFEPRTIKLLRNLPGASQRFVVVGAGVTALAVLALLLYRPYSLWYGQPYSSIQFWNESNLTPINSYLTHWGLFLFVIVTWMIWETRDWMANTPLSSLRKLEPYREAILLALAGLVGILLILQWRALANNHWNGIQIAWLALPLAAWAGVLLLRPGMPDTKRLVLFLIGTGLLITIMVEVVVVRGDIGRMNTVFKFYLQVWTLFAVSAAAALGWLLASISGWVPGWRATWQVAFVALVFSALLFTLLGGLAKVKDRIVATTPPTLDGMAYMQYVTTFDNWGIPLDLSQDARAIRWMQENIQGSPTIVEAGSAGNQYQWYSRYAIYTGLPTVIGWQWHQIQQRNLLPSSWVTDRDTDVELFYTTPDLEYARNFLREYGVRYIILGQLERGKYAGLGLDKFTELEGVLWKQVYQDRDTTIYEVIQ